MKGNFWTLYLIKTSNKLRDWCATKDNINCNVEIYPEQSYFYQRISSDGRELIIDLAFIFHRYVLCILYTSPEIVKVNDLVTFTKYIEG